MPHGNTKGIRAYKVTEKSGDPNPRSVIVFTDDKRLARSIGSRQLEADYIFTITKRAPEFDQYVNLGRVPLMAYLRAGWQFDCQVCGKPVLLGPESIEWGEFYFDSRECQQQFALQFDEHGYKRRQT